MKGDPLPLRSIDTLNEVLGNTIAWLTAAMVLVTCIVVVLRYGFETGAIMLQEAVAYMHGLVFMLGLSYTLKHDAHVRVDLLYSRLSARARACVDIVGHLVFLLPLAVTIIVVSLSSGNGIERSYVGRSWTIRESSAEVGGIPAVFLLKTLIPATGVLLILQGIAETARAIRTLRDG